MPVRPQREAQSYCSRDCRRAAAYGRERFKNGTKARRKRRLEASDKLPATLVAGSFRKGDFSSIETGCYGPTNWIEKLNQAAAHEIDQAYWTREKRNWPIDLIGGQRNRLKSPKLAVDLKVCRTVLHGAASKGRGARAPRKRNRPRVLRGRLSQSS